MPGSARSLPDTLRSAAERGAGSLTFHLEDGPVSMSCAELLERSLTTAAALAERGVEPGDAVGIVGPNRPEWVVGAFATWIAGAGLVPVQIPLRLRDLEGFGEQMRSLIDAGGCRVVLTAPGYEEAVPDGLAMQWDAASRGEHSVPLTGEETAVVQFTSGSTAAPRGAVLTHRAVLAQMRALRDLLGWDPGEVTLVMWTPFFHDLGLFLALVAPVVFAGTLHQLPTERFARNPSEWLRIVTEARGTLTVGPSSAWAAALRGALRGGGRIDLSSLEFACFGAEGVDPNTVDHILAESHRAGLDPSALASTYGLAEAVLCVSANRPGEGLRFDRVDPEAIKLMRAEPVLNGAGRRIISSGRPLLGAEVKIVREGEEVQERELGEIYVRGESMMRGYVGSSESQPIADGWLRTGDLGYLAGGELYVTGRIKDLLIVMGHNYYPDDLEWAAGRVDGVKPGRCAAFVVESNGREGIVLLVEPSGRCNPAELSVSVKHAVANTAGVMPAEVVVLPRGTLEMTTSGKLRRRAMRDAYLSGTLAALSDVGSLA